MRKEIKRLTTAQFARLHEVNKRTLHYYDEIVGLQYILDS